MPRPHIRIARTMGLTLLLALWLAIPVQGQEPPPPQKTVAVIAFANAMGVPELDWIGIGFAESITTKLAHVKALVLVERRLVRAAEEEILRGASGLVDPATAQQAGLMLGAQYVLVGTFQKLDLGTSSQVRVDCRMVRVQSTQIFETFDIRGPYESMFDLQDQLAFQVSGALDVPLSAEEQKLMARHECASLVAYEFFITGLRAVEIPDKIHWYEKALEADPDYVFALTNLGSLYYTESLAGLPTLLERARNLLVRAVELDPLHADAHLVLGSVYEKLEQPELAVRHSEIFLSLRPGDSRAILARRRVERLR